MYQFIFYGKLTNLNEAVGMAKRSPFVYSKMKKEADDAIRKAIRKQIGGLRVGSKPFILLCQWHIPATKNGHVRSDPDNVASAVKYVLDAMQPLRKKIGGKMVTVEPGIIDNDGFENVREIRHTFSRSDTGKHYAKFTITTV